MKTRLRTSAHRGAHVSGAASLPQMQYTNASETRWTEVLASVFCEVLSREHIDPAIDFFDEGGDSLQAIHLTARLRELTGLEIEPQALYTFSTLTALAGHCASLQPTGPIEDGDARAAPTDESVDLASELVPLAPQLLEFIDPTFWEFGETCVRLELDAGPSFDLERMRDAVDRLAREHPALTLSVVRKGNELCFKYPPRGTPLLEVRESLETEVEGRLDPLARFDESVGPVMSENGPLVALACCRTKESTYLRIKASHLILDRHATGLLLSELARFYDQRDYDNDGPERDRYTFRDFLVSADESRQQVAEFWRGHLVGAQPQFLASIDRSGHRAQVPLENFTQTVECSASDLVRACKVLGVSEFVLTLTLFQCVLRLHSVTDNLLVSSTMSARRAPAQMRVIGSLSSAILMSLPTSLSNTIAEISRSTATIVAAATSRLNVSRREAEDIARRDDFINFTMIPLHVTTMESTAAASARWPVRSVRSRGLQLPPDISVNLSVLPDRLSIRYTFNAARVSVELVRKLAEDFGSLITRVRDDAPRVLGSRYDSAERRRAL